MHFDADLARTGQWEYLPHLFFPPMACPAAASPPLSTPPEERALWSPPLRNSQGAALGAIRNPANAMRAADPSAPSSSFA